MELFPAEEQPLRKIILDINKDDDKKQKVLAMSYLPR
jgi:hypothetical protein